MGASDVVTGGMVVSTSEETTGRMGSSLPPLFTINPMPIPTTKPKTAPLAPTMSFN